MPEALWALEDSDWNPGPQSGGVSKQINMSGGGRCTGTRRDKVKVGEEGLLIGDIWTGPWVEEGREP